MDDGFEVDTQVLGPLPVINAFCDRLGLDSLLWQFLPHDDARLKLAPATAVGVVVRHLVVHRRPLCALGEWAAPFVPSLLGLAVGDAAGLDDDRVGRLLARLFHTDQASLLTRLVLDAIEAFGIDVSRLHNDRGSIKFSGLHPAPDGRPRRGKPSAAIARQLSRNPAPVRQLAWILTVTADGAVPIAYRVAGGDDNDQLTHTGTWDRLVALAGRTDFLCVADHELAVGATMDYIDRADGRFLSALPTTFAEDGRFRDWLDDHDHGWTEVERPPARHGDPEDVWWACEAPSAEGYRVVLLRSAADGCFPLITNDRQLTAAELLAAYLWQPNLKKRQARFKATQLVAPAFLDDPARLEGLLCCQFIAMLVQALIEREIHRAMAAAGLRQLSLFPEDRDCAAPTTARVMEIFSGVARHQLLRGGHLVHTFDPQLTPLQRQVLDLLGIPRASYANA